VFIALVIV